MRSIVVPILFLMLLVLAGGCTSGTSDGAAVNENPPETTGGGGSETGLSEPGPLGDLNRDFPVIVGDVAISARPGQIIDVSVPVLLGVGDQTRDFDAEILSRLSEIEASLSASRLELVPWETQFLIVSLAIPQDSTAREYNIGFELVPVDADPGFREARGRVRLGVVNEPELLGPTAVSDWALLAGGIDMDVLANDSAPDGQLDPTTLRILRVAGAVDGDDVVIDGSHIVVNQPERLTNGVYIHYEICSTNGTCADSSLTGYRDPQE